jgi:hemerythrin
MGSLEWSDHFATKIFEIDVQHKRLFAMVNELDQAMQEGRGKQLLGRLLSDLVHYTKSHFTTEERFMQENHYPGYSEHKDKHEKMTRKVLDIQRQFDSGSVHLTLDIMNFLQKWLTEHILKTDLRFGIFLHQVEHGGESCQGACQEGSGDGGK